MKPFESLCYYDKRNPNGFEALNGEPPEEVPKDCYCDNCFYGRTKLANELIKAKQKIEELKNSIRNGKDNNT